MLSRKLRGSFRSLERYRKRSDSPEDRRTDPRRKRSRHEDEEGKRSSQLHRRHSDLSKLKKSQMISEARRRFSDVSKIKNFSSRHLSRSTSDDRGRDRYATRGGKDRSYGKERSRRYYKRSSSPDSYVRRDTRSRKDRSKKSSLKKSYTSTRRRLSFSSRSPSRSASRSPSGATRSTHHRTSNRDRKLKTQRYRDSSRKRYSGRDRTRKSGKSRRTRSTSKSSLSDSYSSDASSKNRRNRSGRKSRKDKDKRKKKHTRRSHSSSSGSSKDSSSSKSSAGSHKKKKSKRRSDSEGAYRGGSGEVIDSRYKILNTLGEGTFGRVVECKDVRNSGRRLAVKVVRGVPRYVDEAKIEAEILEGVQTKFERISSEGGSRIVYLYDHFHWRDHYCLVFEPLGMSLYDFQKKTKYRGFPLRTVRSIARDVFEALEFLHEECKIVHTDLKLENILFEQQFDVEYGSQPSTAPSYRVKLIDFGGATAIKSSSSSRRSSGSSSSSSKLPTSIINTRQYRSPEVTLRMGWSFPSDIWSMGCVLMELVLGHLLFETHDELEHMALISQIVGSFPIEMRKSNDDFFDSKLQMRWPPSRDSKSYSSKSVRYVEKALPLVKQIERACADLDPLPAEEDMEDFTRLVLHCLEIDPSRRIKAKYALESRFLAGKSLTSSSSAP